MTHDAFISYAKADKDAAEAICGALEARGVPCWIAPRDIPLGADYSDAIIDAVTSTSVLLLVFSRHANASRSVRNEVERAFTKNIPIIPVRFEDIEATGGLEFFLGLPQWFNAFPPPTKRHLDRLADRVHDIVRERADAGNPAKKVKSIAEPVTAPSHRTIAIPPAKLSTLGWTLPLGAFRIVMGIVSSLIGVVMVASGSFWTLQGLHLTGPNDTSFMVGDRHWILYGVIFALVGLGQVIWSMKRRWSRKWLWASVVMRIVSSLIGLLIVVMGSFWALQGLHLTGPNDRSFMVGDQRWVLYGAIFVLLGLGQVIWSNTRQR